MLGFRLLLLQGQGSFTGKKKNKPVTLTFSSSITHTTYGIPLKVSAKMLSKIEVIALLPLLSSFLLSV